MAGMKGKTSMRFFESDYLGGQSGTALISTWRDFYQKMDAETPGLSELTMIFIIYLLILNGGYKTGKQTLTLMTTVSLNLE